MNILFALVAVLISTVNAEPYQAQKVVYHINYSDESRIGHTFTNISNHISEVGEENIEVRAVIHGAAIEYFMDAVEDTAKQTRIDTLSFIGTKFIICGNSLDGYQIGIDDLYDVEEQDVVKAGLPEIVRLQQNGFYYVRP